MAAPKQILVVTINRTQASQSTDGRRQRDSEEEAAHSAPDKYFRRERMLHSLNLPYLPPETIVII